MDGCLDFFVSTAIMFYYSVVTGWCIRYFFSAASGSLFNTSEHLAYWNEFSSGYLPLLFHFFAILFAGIVILRGVTNGIERVTKVMIPSLLIIVLILFVRAFTLPNAIEGIKYFFTPDINVILDYKVWLKTLEPTVAKLNNKPPIIHQR